MAIACGESMWPEHVAREPTCPLRSPWKGFCPVASSHSMMAKAYTSLARLTCREERTAGAGSAISISLTQAACMTQLVHTCWS